MGSSQSEFEHRFYNTYHFIQILNDPRFGYLKIYRKTTFNYDYTMIFQKSLGSCDEQYLFNVSEQMRLIKCYQTTNIIRLYQYKILRENVLNCQGPILRIYSQYYNHTLDDYLIALHNKKISLSTDEITYIMKSLLHAFITLQKMKIKFTKITIKKIFISLEGELMLSPLVALFNTRNQTSQENTNCLPLLTKEKKLSLKQHVQTQFIQKQNIMDIFMQLSSYMTPNKLWSQNIYFLVLNCQSLNQLYQKLPYSQNEGLLTSQLFKQNLQTEKNSQDLNFSA